MTIGMVWAQTPGGVIAADGELPWDVPEDFEHFRLTVAGRPVIVGRATWESMPPRWRENRVARGDVNVVVTRGDWSAPGVAVAHSMAQAVALAQEGTTAQPASAQEVWVMGGGQIYALGLELADLLVVSEIDVPEPTGELTPSPAWSPLEWVEATPPDVAGWRTSRTGTRWRIRHLRRD